jgi:hypothetical protein
VGSGAAGRFEIPFFDGLFVFGGAGRGEVGGGEHGQGDVGVPGPPGPDLVVIEAGSFFAVRKHSSIAHRAPATRISSRNGALAEAAQR